MNVMYRIRNALLTGILFLPLFLLFFTGTAGEAAGEKRALQEFPAAFTRTWPQEFSAWLGDHVPFRQALLKAEACLRQGIETPYRENLLPGLSRLLAPSWAKGEEAPLAPLADGYTVYGRDGWLFYADEDNLLYVQGKNKLSDEETAAWAGTYGKLNALCEERGIRLIVLTAPNKEQVYREKLPTLDLEEGPTRAEAFREAMAETGVTFLYPLEELREMSRVRQTYRRTDTHWNRVGAWVGAAAVFRAMGEELPEPVRWDLLGEPQLGDLAAGCGLFQEEEDPKPDFRPEVTAVKTYYENDCVIVCRSDAGEGRKAVVIGDSYCSGLQDYFARSFSFAVLAYREFLEHAEVQSALQELGEGDVLVLMSVERYDARNVQTAGKLAEAWEKQK